MRPLFVLQLLLVCHFCDAQVIPKIGASDFKLPPKKTKPVTKSTKTTSLSPLEKANDYFEKKQFAAAYSIYNNNQERLDETEKYRLAWMNFEGKGTSKNIFEGLSLAAGIIDKTTDDNIKGYLISDMAYAFKPLFILADSAMMGKYAKYIFQMADKKYTHAMWAVGWTYAYGPSSLRNYTQALSYLKEGSALGDSKCTAYVGFLYADGKGVPKDISKAIEWCNKAIAQGGPHGYFVLGYIYGDKDYGVFDIDKAINNYEKAGQLGSGTAYNNIGTFYSNGIGVSQDRSKAFDMFTKGKDLGDYVAMYNLGLYYYHGHAVSKDINEAVNFLNASAVLGYTSAMNFLGNIFEDNESNKGNIFDAYNYYKKGARLEDVSCLFNVGRISYAWNEYNDALNYFSKGADLGSADCLYALGMMYEEGDGVRKNLYTAKSFYRKAADKGHSKAATKVRELD